MSNADDLASDESVRSKKVRQKFQAAAGKADAGDRGEAIRRVTEITVWNAVRADAGNTAQSAKRVLCAVLS